MIKHAEISDRLIGFTIMGVLVASNSIQRDWPDKLSTYTSTLDNEDDLEPISIVTIDKDGKEQTILVYGTIILPDSTVE